MNTKTILIVGGASAASLAAGGTAGYFVAKRKFDATVEGRIAEEVEKTKKYFSILLQEAKAGKPDSPADISFDGDDIVSEHPDPEVEELLSDEEQPEEYTEADLKAIEKGRRTLAEASTALVDYRGMSEKPPLEEVVHNNIFSANGSKPTAKKAAPKRGAGGKFVKKVETNPETTPYLITAEEFLLNEGEYEQRNLLYFKNDDTIIDLENNDDVVANGVIGEVNLTLFPEVDDDEAPTICVRNEGLETDYEVRLMAESLTHYLGLGENEGYDEDDVNAAENPDAYAEENDDEDDDVPAEHYV